MVAVGGGLCNHRFVMVEQIAHTLLSTYEVRLPLAVERRGVANSGPAP